MKKLPKIIDILILFLINVFLLKYSYFFSAFISLFLFLGFYAFRTYELDTMNSLNESIIRIFSGFMMGSMMLLVFYPFFENQMCRYTFIYNLLFSIVIFPLIHKIEYILYEKHVSPKKYLVIGKKNEIGHILDEIQQKTLNKLQFIDYINPSPIKLEELVNDGFSKKEKSRIEKIINFTYRNNQTKYDAIIVTDPKLEKIVKDKLEEYKKAGIPIEYLPNIAEKYLKRIPLEVIERFEYYYSVIFDEEKESPAKRIVDVTFGIMLSILFFPINLIFSILIFLEDGRPIIFKQERVGKNEKIFILKKLRSLKNTKIDPDNPNKKIDQSVLKVGKIIRKFRIDESMQFINVIQGTMSLVGPRPEMIEFHEKMKKQIPYYLYRLKTNPGITGWAQINYKHTTTLEDYIKKTEYDLYYIKNRSSLLDFRIMLLTLETMLGMRGAR
ncbi:glycosyl transferase possibly involved in lipopolysaccharide synthesis [Marinitoga piezophila KA3]|uniref:Glycosyl transferase possibly involved in lipopolysaccharide synthesis n=1 Tax=Marinitoga piezophila (strain DSM 14283 / JCM 11233 / KA3) TaxID=443254 RepID=H2J8E4_MARPK|nr:sugar transferase [Marinitoga piezophila]AEX85628.1 glycosyl transferase possibly involved in lipopolysaccharide synthesis [Marinitoga piezophila KA3]